MLSTLLALCRHLAASIHAQQTRPIGCVRLVQALRQCHSTMPIVAAPAALACDHRWRGLRPSLPSSPMLHRGQGTHGATAMPMGSLCSAAWHPIIRAHSCIAADSAPLRTPSSNKSETPLQQCQTRPPFVVVVLCVHAASPAKKVLRQGWRVAWLACKQCTESAV